MSSMLKPKLNPWSWTSMSSPLRPVPLPLLGSRRSAHPARHKPSHIGTELPFWSALPVSVIPKDAGHSNASRPLLGDEALEDPAAPPIRQCTCSSSCTLAACFVHGRKKMQTLFGGRLLCPWWAICQASQQGCQHCAAGGEGYSWACQVNLTSDMSVVWRVR